MYTKSDLDTLFDKKPHKTDVYMKSNVSTLRWQMWQNKHRSENKAWKKFRPVRDLNPWPLRYQPGAGHYVGSKETREVMNRWLWIWKSYLFFRLYFHYCLSSVHYCEDRSHIHFFIRISHIRFSYIHRQDYNYYKGKMAHNNTQQMESYYNTSINHSINVKQSHDVHFVCGSNNRNKLKIINTGLYMMTIFNEYKSTQTRIYNRI